MEYNNLMKFLKFIIVFLFIQIFGVSLAVEPTQTKKIDGSYSKVLNSEKEKVLLLFDNPVEAVVGKNYKTDIKGLTFTVLDISPNKNRVYGVFNKSFYINPEYRLFVYGVYSSADLIAANQPAVVPNRWNFRFENLSYSLFYTFSFGSFDERIKGTDFSAESTQNSYFTLGGSLNFKFHEQFSFSGSGYFSKLNSAISTNAEIDPTKKNADIPWEFGFTSYLEYSGFKYQIKPYVGFDFESFSTFNTDEVKKQDDDNNSDNDSSNDKPLIFDLRTHSFLYGTFGVFTLTKILERPSIIKASISTNLTSSSSRPSTVSDEDFNGQKFIFFVGMNVFKNWGATFMYKQHMMKGPTDLTISRLGFGVSYRFQ